MKCICNEVQFSWITFTCSEVHLCVLFYFYLQLNKTFAITKMLSYFALLRDYVICDLIVKRLMHICRSWLPDTFLNVIESTIYFYLSIF